MRRAERLFRLVKELRSRRVSRADDLAAHLEVSVRTVYRDIAHLQASGLPIEGEAGVGYLLRPGFDLPSVTFTHDQVDALAVGLSFVESLDDQALASAAREVRDKIEAGMPNPEARKLSGSPFFSVRRNTGAAGLVQAVRSAIRDRRMICLDYENQVGQRTRRRVRPLAVWSFENGWMFSGWCDLRGDFRTFRFDRIATLTVTDERFEPEESKGLALFLERDRCEVRTPP